MRSLGITCLIEEALEIKMKCRTERRIQLASAQEVGRDAVRW
jgi:hypothetical protein